MVVDAIRSLSLISSKSSYNDLVMSRIISAACEGYYETSIYFDKFNNSYLEHLEADGFGYELKRVKLKYKLTVKWA